MNNNCVETRYDYKSKSEYLNDSESKNSLETIDINQRRYLGNKHSLIDFIKSVIKKEIGEFRSFCDLFAGTGVVADCFNNEDIKIIVNENLYTNFIPLKAWFSSDSIRKDFIINKIKEFQKIDTEEDNYVSKHFGNRYFSENIAKKIGSIRKRIEKLDSNKKINTREKSILLTSLFYGFDRIANTCGHYDAYRGTPTKEKELKLRMPNIFSDKKNKNNNVILGNANEVIQNLNTDILYLDPPYNSRQYCDMYHLPENILRWEKPRVYGKAKKFDRSKLKSDYNRKAAQDAFRDLISKANSKYIILSYNNMGDKGHSRSNAKIPDEVIKKTLSNKGVLTTFTKDYKYFNTGKRDIQNHKERLFLCEVT